jgi:glutathione S-transferase
MYGLPSRKRLLILPTRLDCDAGEQATPEYLALNPNAFVPAMVHDGRLLIDPR